MLHTKRYSKFLLLLGKDSLDLFNYFRVDELHGLTKKEAQYYPETKKDAYIAGMTNYSPTKDKFPYMFINVNRLNGSKKDATAIMHECVHLSLLLHDWDIENSEETIVSDAERIANEVIDYISNLKF